MLRYDLLLITEPFLKDRHCFLVIISGESKARNRLSSRFLHMGSQIIELVNFG